MPAFGQVHPLHRVAIGQQHRVAVPVTSQCDPETRHDIGTVEIESDLPEAFRLALRAEHLLGDEQTFQGGIRSGIDVVFDADDKLPVLRHLGDGQCLRPLLVLPCSQIVAIQGDTEQRQALAVQHQAGVLSLALRIARHGQTGDDAGLLLIQIEMQIDAANQILRRRVIAQIDGTGIRFSHVQASIPSCRMVFHTGRSASR